MFNFGCQAQNELPSHLITWNYEYLPDRECQLDRPEFWLLFQSFYVADVAQTWPTCFSSQTSTFLKNIFEGRSIRAKWIGKGRMPCAMTHLILVHEKCVQQCKLEYPKNNLKLGSRFSSLNGNDKIIGKWLRGTLLLDFFPGTYKELILCWH